MSTARCIDEVRCWSLWVNNVCTLSHLLLISVIKGKSFSFGAIVDFFLTLNFRKWIASGFGCLFRFSMHNPHVHKLLRSGLSSSNRYSKVLMHTYWKAATMWIRIGWVHDHSLKCTYKRDIVLNIFKNSTVITLDHLDDNNVRILPHWTELFPIMLYCSKLFKMPTRNCRLEVFFALKDACYSSW